MSLDVVAYPAVVNTPSLNKLGVFAPDIRTSGIYVSDVVVDDRVPKKSNEFCVMSYVGPKLSLRARTQARKKM